MSRLLRRIMARARTPRRSTSPKVRLLLLALERRIAPAAFTVTNTGDAGTGLGTSGDLRYCITQANLTTGPNSIDATGVRGKINLAFGALSISNSLAITGPTDNGLIISGNNTSQVFSISGTGRTVVLKNLEITGGNATTSGGGVFMGANSVTFDTDWIHGNQTTATGGGIGSTAGASITVKNSAITGNTAAGAGGGIYGTSYNGSTTIVVQNSTLSGNSSGGVGGGIGTTAPPVFEQPAYPSGVVSLHNCTVTNNTGTGAGGGIGESGRVYVPVSLISSIVAGNNGPTGATDFLAQTVSATQSAIGSTTGIVSYQNMGGNLIGANLGLQSLAFNGGPTPTVALLMGSPAVDAGSNPDGQQFDQRGAGYPRGAPAGFPDIGAFERQPGLPSAAATAPNLAGANSPNFQFTLTYSDDTAVLYSSVNGNSNAVTVTPPVGVAPVAVSFVSAVPTGNAPTITATYQFTFPTGLATGADNGLWTVNMAGNQVENVNSVFVPAGRLTTFLVQVPRTITVTNTNFAGAGSLLDAISQANADAPSADTIVFSNSNAGGATDFTVGPHTITLLAQLPTIANAVTITGPGAALLTVNANGTGRVLATNVPAGSTVTLSGLTLTGGAVVGDGGGIDAISGNLALSGMTIRGNSAISGNLALGSGGGVYNAGNLTVTNSVITGNSARYGGGICNAYSNTTGVITISSSSISNNTAFGFGGGIDIDERGPTLIITGSTLANNVAGSFGGAIDDYYYGSVTIIGSALVGNSAGRDGGGLYYQGGFATIVTINDSTIANNTAAGDTSSSGGGIALGVYGNCTLNITSSTITGNTAQAITTANRNNYVYGGGGINVKDGFGVAIHLDNTIVSGNHAANGRDDIAGYNSVTTAYSAIGNTAGFTYAAGTGDLPVGAALNLKPLADNGGPTPTIALGVGSSAIDHGDPALAGTADQRGVTRPQGPAVDIGAYEWIPNPDAVATGANVTTAGGTTYTFTVTYSDNVPINTATLGSGNVIVTTPAGVPPVTVTYVSANTTNPDSVVATYQFTAPGGAWTRADNGAYTITMQPNQVSDGHGTVPAGQIAVFQVLVPRTLTVTNPGDAGTGSGVTGDLRYCITQADLDGAAADTIVFSNGTVGGATNFYDGATRTITLLSSLPTVTDAATIAGPGAAALTINANATGSVLVASPGSGNTVTINGLALTGGTTVGNGGGIEVVSGNFVLSNAVIAHNSAAAGAGVYSTSIGAITVTDSTITGNTTIGFGGGIDLASYVSSLLTITGSTISNNSAGRFGGGVYLAAGDVLLLQQSTVAGNTAFTGGGLFWYNSGAALISQCTISGNVATGGYNGSSEGGGGLTFFGAVFTTSTNPGEPLTGFTLRDSTIAGNTAVTGGGIYFRPYLVGGRLSVVGCTITGNTSTATSANYFLGGGGIGFSSDSGSTLALDDTIVSGNYSGTGRHDVASYFASAVTTAYSAIGNTTGFTYTPGPGDLPIGANLHLQPLANNGGPTQTIAFGAGSPLLNAGDPALANTTDQRGVPRNIGPAPDIGAYEYQPITVANVQVNDGSAQRSEVRSITVTFSGPVSFANGNAAAAFQLQHVQDSTNVNNLAAAVSTNGSGETVVTLTFTTAGNAAAEIDPVSAQNGGMASLADGRFQLTVLGSAVSDAVLGWALDGGGNGTPGGNYVSPADTLGGGPGQLHLFRLFGDVDGDGLIDQIDLGYFRDANNTVSGAPGYLAFLDANNDGKIDQIDLGEFRTRNNSSVFAAMVPGVAPPGSGSGNGNGPVESPVAAPALPTVAPIVVNGGNAQRSEARSICVTVSAPVAFSGGTATVAVPSQLKHPTEGNGVTQAVAVSADNQKRTVRPSIAGAETDPLSDENGGILSLADGPFTLTILSGSVTGNNGLALAAGGPNGNYVRPADTRGGAAGQLHLYRPFADLNGDGIVDQLDLGQFRAADHSSLGSPAYVAYLDADNDGAIGPIDLGQFLSRFDAGIF